MAKTKKPLKKKTEIQQIEEYNKILEFNKNSFIVPLEWREYGDVIQQFTIYENYTPVKISSGTTLNN